MVTFLEFILIIGFKNGCFSVNPFPKDRRYFISRELDAMDRLGIIREDRTNDFSMITTEFGEAIIRRAIERLGDEVASRLTITDIESTAFVRYHLYPDYKISPRDLTGLDS